MYIQKNLKVAIYSVHFIIYSVKKTLFNSVVTNV